MTRDYDGNLHVHYGQFYIAPSDSDGSEDLIDSFHGQVNGLCGASLPGSLFLITGLHTGNVHVTIDILDVEPQVDNSWDEIVEVSLTVDSSEMQPEDWDGRAYYLPSLSAGNYRVRYCARNMDLGSDIDTLLDNEEPVDFYSLIFWPAEAAVDRVIKQISRRARYWHNVVQE